VLNLGVTNFIKHTLLDLKIHTPTQWWWWKTSILLCHQEIGHPDQKRKNQQRNAGIE
jgi:hypothetical protein